MVMYERKFDKKTVIKKLQENRNQHRDAFEAAVDGWQKEMERLLLKAVKEVKGNKTPRPIVFNIPIPKDHTRDYDAVISFLEISLKDQVTLSESDYRKYMLDDWEWKGEFTGTNAYYANNG